MIWYIIPFHIKIFRFFTVFSIILGEAIRRGNTSILDMREVQQLLEEIGSEKKRAIIGLQTGVLRSMSDFMYERKVPQLMPIMLSTFTDPLFRSVFDASISYYGQELKLMKSMTAHKQIMVLSVPKFFVVSPNIRLEKEDTSESGRHLIEFSQLDMEFRDWDKWKFMDFMEDLLIHVLEDVVKRHSKELKVFGRSLSVPKKPFERYESKELAGEKEAAVQKLSECSSEPFWVLDHAREFYDREDELRDGYFHNYDLIYPEGFSEALSGGEREFDYSRLVKAMQRSGQDPKAYEHYMKLAESGHLGKSAGGGLGVERLLRYCTGVKHIDEVCLFSRRPGKKILL